MSIPVWVPPSLTTIIGTAFGWWLGQISTKKRDKEIQKREEIWISRAKDAALATITFDVKTVQKELSTMQNNINLAREKGQKDYIFYSPNIFQRRFRFQTVDISSHSSFFYLLDKDMRDLLVKFDSDLHPLNLAYDFLSGSGLQAGLSVDKILNLDEQVEANKQLKGILYLFIENIATVLKDCDEIIKKSNLP